MTVRCNYVLGDAGTSEILIRDSKQYLIKDDAIFYRAPPKNALPRITSLLKHAVRRNVSRVGHSVNPCEGKLLEPILCDRADSRGHDASVPKALPQPIANLRGDSLDVVVELQANAASNLGIDLNRDSGSLCLSRRERDPFFCVR